MLDELRLDLTERRSYRRAVDFGHTLSPALEAATRFSFSHGLAVAVDMAFAAALSLERGSLDRITFERMVACLRSVELPVWHDALSLDFCKRALRAASEHRGGRVNFVIPTGIGSHDFVETLDELDDDLLRGALAELRRVGLVGLDRDGAIAANL
jgi:2-epi-5-epi-valiolone synthase